jgi:hypothetical protein
MPFRQRLQPDAKQFPIMDHIVAANKAHHWLLQTLPKWHQSGTPWLFLHTPDIAYVPALVDTLWGETVPDYGPYRRRQ